VSVLDAEGRTIWIVDAYGYGKRFEQSKRILRDKGCAEKGLLLVGSGTPGQLPPITSGVRYRVLYSAGCFAGALASAECTS
jgi:hypothetical protein